MKYTEICPHCLEKSSEDERLCPNCGKKKSEIIESAEGDPSLGDFIEESQNSSSTIRILLKSAIWLIIMLGSIWAHPLLKGLDIVLWGIVIILVFVWIGNRILDNFFND